MQYSASWSRKQEMSINIVHQRLKFAKRAAKEVFSSFARAPHKDRKLSHPTHLENILLTILQSYGIIQGRAP
jgi:hypothetical protein